MAVKQCHQQSQNTTKLTAGGTGHSLILVAMRDSRGGVAGQRQRAGEEKGAGRALQVTMVTRQTGQTTVTGIAGQQDGVTMATMSIPGTPHRRIGRLVVMATRWKGPGREVTLVTQIPTMTVTDKGQWTVGKGKLRVQVPEIRNINL